MDLPIFTGICKYVYEYWYRVEKQPVAMSLKVWDTLSEEDQAILMKAGEAAVAKGWEIARKIDEASMAKAVAEWGYEEVIELTTEQHMANIKAIREQVWPELEKTLGKDVMDYARAIAVPLE
jgi:TRAP-type C4-dicarboxylate transport system substrate-binding protein